MSESDLMYRPALGELTARELAEVSLRAIDEKDGPINAFAQVDHDGALAAADAIGPGDERPFAGVPIAIKDSRAVAGLRMSHGCELMRDFVAPYDHNVTRRLREAGCVIVGKTTLPEYAILPTTEAHLFGPTQNPWRRGWSPSPTGPTAAGRSGSRPPAAGWSGSSPLGAGSRRHPSSATRRWGSTGC